MGLTCDEWVEMGTEASARTVPIAAAEDGLGRYQQPCHSGVCPEAKHAGAHDGYLVLERTRDGMGLVEGERERADGIKMVVYVRLVGKGKGTNTTIHHHSNKPPATWRSSPKRAGTFSALTQTVAEKSSLHMISPLCRLMFGACNTPKRFHLGSHFTGGRVAGVRSATFHTVIIRVSKDRVWTGLTGRDICGSGP
jgi:hypothetical protein